MNGILKFINLKLKKTYLLIVYYILFCCFHARSFNYNEHKKIGNHAFEIYLQSLENKLRKDLIALFPVEYDKNGNRKLNAFSRYASITYGDLNALAGDHAANPHTLYEELMTNFSSLLKTFYLHQSFADMQYDGAPNAELVKTDKLYLHLAVKNLSHFYRYGEPLSHHVNGLSQDIVEKLLVPSLSDESFKKLNRTNLLLMYATVHAAAIKFSFLSGQSLKRGDRLQAEKYIHYAYLFNGFADHFLQDSFSSGHLLVNRTISASLTNNKALHDFYCKHATSVVNAKGERWRAFGDGQFNRYHSLHASKDTVTQISYNEISEESKRIIHACAVSLSELEESFYDGLSGKENGMYDRFTHAVTNNKKYSIIYVFKALQHVPLPYTTLSKDNVPDSLKVKPNLAANSKPYTRNFIRSRVSNSIVAGITTNAFLSRYYFEGIEIRINAGTLLDNYTTPTEKGKKGTVDSWLGYTFSLASGRVLQQVEMPLYTTHLYKAGIRGNTDVWITNKKFIGLFYYLESGMGVTNADKYFAISPQVGIQLGSLINVNYYNLPTAIRLPLQLILPLKFKYSFVYAGDRPHFSSTGVELDLVF